MTAGLMMISDESEMTKKILDYIKGHIRNDCKVASTTTIQIPREEKNEDIELEDCKLYSQDTENKIFKELHENLSIIKNKCDGTFLVEQVLIADTAKWEKLSIVVFYTKQVGFLGEQFIAGPNAIPGECNGSHEAAQMV